jgi:hypothetical protein
VNVNINKFSSDPNAGCNGFGTQLNGFDDWSNLVYLPPATASGITMPSQQEVEQQITIEEVRESRLVLLDGINNAIGRLGGSIDLSAIAELLQTDELEAAIAELAELKEQVIAQFGEEAANREVVPQIDNLIGALEKQLPSDSPPTPPPASDCVGTGSGNSVITGTPDPDTLIGTNGVNSISGLGGDDSINGCAGSDRIDGNADNDGIAGGPGNDVLNGNAGNDLIQGDEGNDQLSGGAGINTLTGGPGRDSFICSPNSETTITDFEQGVDRMSGPCLIETEVSTATLTTNTSETTPETQREEGLTEIQEEEASGAARDAARDTAIERYISAAAAAGR